MSHRIDHVIDSVAACMPSLEAMEKPSNRELRKAEAAERERTFLRLIAQQWAIENLPGQRYEDFEAAVAAGRFVDAYHMLTRDGVMWPWRKSQWDRWVAAELAAA